MTLRWLPAMATGMLGILAFHPPAPQAAGTATVESAIESISAKPIDDMELKSFADAAREVFRIRQAFAPKVQSAKSEMDARDVIVAAEKEMGKAIRRAGLTVARYNEILRAAQRDPSLAGRIQALVDKAAAGK